MFTSVPSWNSTTRIDPVVRPLSVKVAPDTLINNTGNAVGSTGWQVPALHTPVAHGAPSATFPLATQMAVPVAQEVAPVLQALSVGVHAVPAVQATQVPDEQTRFVPQGVPSVTFPLATQMAVPVAQEVAPVLQALSVGVHAVPAVQPTQVPDEQTRFVPQGVPSVAFPLVTQVAVPVAQEVAPVLQALSVGVHAVPAVQPTQVPDEQTRFVPQGVPSAAFPLVTQVAVPVAQEVAPVLQALLVGVHAAPAAQATQLPAEQTRFVPQGVPPARLVPMSVHTGAPEQQEIVPAWQTLAGTQDDPLVHTVQAPPLHTLWLPHDVPFGVLPVRTHTVLPVVHEVVPVAQTLPAGVQARPVVQATQLPAEQTRLLPQEVPLATGAPVSVHVGVPAAQDRVPAWHGFAGTHDVPAAQATQLPVRQTSLSPHDDPSGASATTAQTGVPVPHEVRPSLHVTSGVQARPAAQPTHNPALHTRSAPQEVPLATGIPVSLQIGIPPSHVRVPVWHGFAGVHALPAAHATQDPSLQIWPVPQVWPFGTLVVSRQTALPVLHDVTPLRHGLPATGHVLPASQAAQIPWSQTRLTPQPLPSASAAPESVHVGVPPAHESVPRWQRFTGTHVAPDAHATHAPSEHTSARPHDRPLSAFPATTQTGSPVPHSVRPSAQGFPGTSQLVPAAHVAHTPPRQTLSGPHAVPFAWGLPVSEQNSPSLPHARIPTWHGSTGVQPPPIEQASLPVSPSATSGTAGTSAASASAPCLFAASGDGAAALAVSGASPLVVFGSSEWTLLLLPPPQPASPPLRPSHTISM